MSMEYEYLWPIHLQCSQQPFPTINEKTVCMCIAQVCFCINKATLLIKTDKSTLAINIIWSFPYVCISLVLHPIRLDIYFLAIITYQQMSNLLNYALLHHPLPMKIAYQQQAIVLRIRKYDNQILEKFFLPCKRNVFLLSYLLLAGKN